MPRPGAALTFTLIAMAIPASAVHAQTLEFTHEFTGNHCPSVTRLGNSVDGGCLIHATSEWTVELRKHVFGIESTITSCNHEFHARLNEDGTGYVIESNLTGAGCARQACKDQGVFIIPWSASAYEGLPSSGVGEGSEYLTVGMCYEPVGGGTDEMCELDIPYQTDASHRGELGHVFEMPSHGFTSSRCEIVGHWNTEAGSYHQGDFEEEAPVAHLN